VERAILVVKAVDVGWALESSLSEALTFVSGAAAEQAARALAQRIAEMGTDVSINITDRAGALVSVIHYYSAIL
jgi:hypothetical protein